MNNFIFLKSLEFELYLIGYKHKGESIVFFLKCDSKVVYAGVVDSYERNSSNIAIDLLKKNNRKSFDFICCTHPHEDHIKGIESIIETYSNEKTNIWIYPIRNTNDKYTKIGQKLYNKLCNIVNSKNEFKPIIRETADCKTLCYKKIYKNPQYYNFEIKSFAPDSSLILPEKLKPLEKIEQINLFSIGLIITIGNFNILLGGDVENTTIANIPDYSIDYIFDYVKIPHHGSRTAKLLIDRLKIYEVTPKNITTTTYKQHELPKIDILKKYQSLGKKTKIYISENINDDISNIEDYGLIKTTFDILEQAPYPIETILKGNAILYKSET